MRYTPRAQHSLSGLDAELADLLAQILLADIRLLPDGDLTVTRVSVCHRKEIVEPCRNEIGERGGN